MAFSIKKIQVDNHCNCSIIRDDRSIICNQCSFMDDIKCYIDNKFASTEPVSEVKISIREVDAVDICNFTPIVNNTTTQQPVYSLIIQEQNAWKNVKKTLNCSCDQCIKKHTIEWNKWKTIRNNTWQHVTNTSCLINNTPNKVCNEQKNQFVLPIYNTNIPSLKNDVLNFCQCTKNYKSLNCIKRLKTFLPITRSQTLKLRLYNIKKNLSKLATDVNNENDVNTNKIKFIRLNKFFSYLEKNKWFLIYRKKFYKELIKKLKELYNIGYFKAKHYLQIFSKSD